MKINNYITKLLDLCKGDSFGDKLNFYWHDGLNIMMMGYARLRNLYTWFIHLSCQILHLSCLSCKFLFTQNLHGESVCVFFLPMYFFSPSTTTHFSFLFLFFSFLYPFSFLSFALVDFGGWFLLVFLFCLFWGHFYKG